MKRLLCIVLGLAMGLLAAAQTQRGYVKTKGRMVDGRLVAGRGLPGASVAIEGRTAIVVQQADGSFAFPMPGQQFAVKAVTKQGYQLVDASELGRRREYSENPVYLVMETPEEQLEDRLAAQEKIGRGLRRQYEQSIAENRRLREERKITEAEYERNLQRMASEQRDNAKLVREMAERYARIDYDQLDELAVRINSHILNGELRQADSLLRTKGDMTARAAAIKREWRLLGEAKSDMQQRKQTASHAREQLQKRKSELAADCFSKAEIFKMQHRVDSAMHYLLQRADLDTLNTNWQYDYAYYCYDMFFYSEAIARLEQIVRRSERGEELTAKNLLAILYHENGRQKESTALFEEILEQRRIQAAENPETAMSLANALMSLGNAYKRQNRNEEGKRLLTEALGIFRTESKKGNREAEAHVGHSLYNLATLYANEQQYAMASKALEEAVGIYRSLSDKDPKSYAGYLATSLRLLGALYSELDRSGEGERLLKESVEIYRTLFQDDPQKYGKPLSETLKVLSAMYRELRRTEEYEQTYAQIASLQRQYAKADPVSFGDGLVATLDTLAAIYRQAGRMELYDSTMLEKIGFERTMVRLNPQRHEPNLAWDLRLLAMRFWSARTDEGLALCLESVQLYEKLAKDQPQYYEIILGDVYATLGNYYLKKEQATEAEQAFLRAVELSQRWEQTYPSATFTLAFTLQNLGYVYEASAQWEKCIAISQQALATCRKLAAVHPEETASDVISIRSSMAHAYYEQGNYLQATECMAEALDSCLACYGEKHEKTATAYNSLSFYSLFLRHYEQAEGLARKALEAGTAFDLPYTNLAAALLLQGRGEEAETVYRQIADKYRDGILADLDAFEKAGLIDQGRRADVERIRQMTK